MRIRALIAPVAAAALLLGACAGGGTSSSAPASGTTGAADADAVIEIGSLYAPTNLSNVGGGGQGATEALSRNVYEGLYSLQDDGTVEPLLATGEEVSEDGLTHTLTIREGVTFSSGKTLTAADVVASIEAVLAEDSQSSRKSQLSVIEKAEATDEHTVTLTLSKPSISLDYNLAHVWIVPEGVDTTTTTDGTGPYTVENWTQGSSLTLTRRDDYWGDAPKNAGVVFHYYTDATALTNALQAGDIDVITSLQSPDALTTFSSNPAFTVSEGTSTTKELLAFNDRVAPFDDARVRRAVYSAIDRAKLLSSVWGDAGTLIGSMVPPTDPWYEDLTDLNPYDVELAKSLLAESGHADGFTFTLDTPTYDPHPLVAEFLKSELAKVGITVEINSITADEWYSKVYKEHDFQATLQEHVNTRDVVWYGNPDFYWGYDNPQVTDLVDRAETAATTDEQTALLKEANRLIAGDAASAWLYLYPQVVVSSSEVTGYWLNGLNSQFPVAGISKNS